MMGRAASWVLVLAAGTAFTAACGSSGEEQGPEVDSGPADTSTDATDAVPPETSIDSAAPDTPDETSETGPTCAWVRADEGLAGGSVATVAFDPRPGGKALAIAGDAFAAPASGGTFTRLGSAPLIFDLAFPSGAPSSIFAGANTGMLHSKDAGATWPVSGLSGVAVTSIHIHPSDPLRLFAGTNSGLFRSNDGGASWAAASGSVAGAYVTGVLGSTTDRDHVVVSYIALNDAGGWSNTGGVLRSTNGGTSWTKTFDGGRVHRLNRCTNAGAMWVATSTGLAKSADNGVTWSVVTTTGTYVDIVGSEGCGTLYASQYPTGVVRSVDGGSTWSTPLTSGMELQEDSKSPGRLAIHPTDPKRVLAATHGGLYSTTDGADKWTNVPGIRNFAIRNIVSDGTNLLLSSYGSGVWRRPIAGGDWKRSTSLPRDFVGGVFASKAKAGLILAATYFPGALWRSTDAGVTFTKTPSADNVFDIVFHPMDADVVFAATQTAGVQKSIDGGQTWTAVNGGLTAWPTPAGTLIDVRAIAIHSTESNKMAIGTAGRGFFATTDGGTSWTSAGGAFASASINTIVADPKSNTLYAQIVDTGVARSTDFGATWSLLTGGLPSTDVNLTLDPTTGDAYAATSKGLYVLTAGGTTWAAAVACTGDAPLGRSIIIDTASGRRLYAASGGGVIARPL